MENVSDALKIAFAVLVFLMGLASLFYMSSLCVETSRVLISESDETKYYSYLDSDDELVDENGNRIVEMKDIIPAIYRYEEENYGITIIDDGKIVARFDLDTETAVNNWLSMSTNNKTTMLNYINENILESLGFRGYSSLTELEALYQKLYGQNNTSTSSTIRRDYYCYWAATDGYTSQRIDSDLSGIYVTFSLTNKGTQSYITSDIVANHIPCVSGGLINEYSDDTFTEYIVEVDSNSYITNEDESLFSFGILKTEVKREIIYVLND